MQRALEGAAFEPRAEHVHLDEEAAEENERREQHGKEHENRPGPAQIEHRRRGTAQADQRHKGADGHQETHAVLYVAAQPWSVLVAAKKACRLVQRIQEKRLRDLSLVHASSITKVVPDVVEFFPLRRVAAAQRAGVFPQAPPPRTACRARRCPRSRRARRKAKCAPLASCRRAWRLSGGRSCRRSRRTPRRPAWPPSIAPRGRRARCSPARSRDPRRDRAKPRRASRHRDVALIRPGLAEAFRVVLRSPPADKLEVLCLPGLHIEDSRFQNHRASGAAGAWDAMRAKSAYSVQSSSCCSPVSGCHMRRGSSKMSPP